MRGKLHLITGASLALSAGAALLSGGADAPSAAAFAAGAVLGSLLPDGDSPGAMIRRFGIIFPGPHRGLSHALYFPALSAAAAYVLPGAWAYLCAGLCLGILLHLLADSLSPAGICWLYPFTPHRIGDVSVLTRRRHLVLYRSGSASEYIVCAVLSIFAAAAALLSLLIWKGGLFG